MYYDKDGSPITALEMDTKMDVTYKRVGYTKLKSGNIVSTVWLGIDHSFSCDGPPIIFETMVLTTQGCDSLDCQRYSTLQEAELGHDEMVKTWERKG